MFAQYYSTMTNNVVTAGDGVLSWYFYGIVHHSRDQMIMTLFMVYMCKGKYLYLYIVNCASSVCPGATTAPTLIFILPGLFYIRIIPTDQEPMNSRPKIQVG